ncbi:MAG: hypothetical protein HC925_07330 [Coleofasciculaceae cyanobacterium SM2_3_26]|nr:hypothetical protein [Coleofasciculaceae cyanobacterium SM2_3_26]
MSLLLEEIDRFDSVDTVLTTDAEQGEKHTQPLAHSEVLPAFEMQISHHLRSLVWGIERSQIACSQIMDPEEIALYPSGVHVFLVLKGIQQSDEIGCGFAEFFF